MFLILQLFVATSKQGTPDQGMNGNVYSSIRMSWFVKDFWISHLRSLEDHKRHVVVFGDDTSDFDVMDVMLRLRMDDFKPVNLSMTLWAFARFGIPFFSVEIYGQSETWQL